MANKGDGQCYKYTKDDLFITKTQRDFYENNGYLLFRKLVDNELLDECTQRFLDICNDKVDEKPFVVMKDLSLTSKNAKGEFLINKIQDFPDDKVLSKYISYKPTIDIISSIIGPNVTVFHNMIINKPPNADQNFSRHPMHQDLYHFPIRPPNSIVAAWTAMEHCDENNGCLFLLPGSHIKELKVHEYPPGVKSKGYHEILGFDDAPRINLIMEKGDTIIFHPLLLHGSGPNFSKGFRKAITAHYVDSNSYRINVRGTIQEHIGKEFEQIYSKYFKSPVNFAEIMRIKSRVVRGSPGNFQKIDNFL